MIRPTVALDIDGVCADMSAFEHLLMRNDDGKIPVDRWEAFWAHYPDAGVLDDGLDLAHAIEALGYRVAYTTTRANSWKDRSKLWLREAEFPMERSLLARMKHQSRIPASVVKVNHAKVLTARLEGAPLVIVDDEQAAVDHLRENEYTAITAAQLPRSINALRGALDELFTAAARSSKDDLPIEERPTQL